MAGAVPGIDRRTDGSSWPSGRVSRPMARHASRSASISERVGVVGINGNSDQPVWVRSACRPCPDMIRSWQPSLNPSDRLYPDSHIVLCALTAEL
jgi:hypothetical protein